MDVRVHVSVFQHDAMLLACRDVLPCVCVFRVMSLGVGGPSRAGDGT